MDFSGRLLSINVYHRSAEIETAAGVIVLTIASHVATRIQRALRRAASERKSLTVKAFGAEKVGAGPPRLADPAAVVNATWPGIYADIERGDPAAIDFLPDVGFRLHRTKRGAVRIVHDDADTAEKYSAKRVHCVRRRLPSGAGRMPLAGSSGESAASWMDRCNPLRD